MSIYYIIHTGRRYDKYGRKRMWWSEEAVQAFKDRSQCFVEQYSNYEMFGLSVSVCNVMLIHTCML